MRKIGVMHHPSSIYQYRTSIHPLKNRASQVLFADSVVQYIHLCLQRFIRFCFFFFSSIFQLCISFFMAYGDLFYGDFKTSRSATNLLSIYPSIYQNLKSRAYFLLIDSSKIECTVTLIRNPRFPVRRRM